MENLREKLYKMLIIGFDGQNIKENDKLINDIKNGLGGVILFDRYINDQIKAKNIASVNQLKELTSSLQSISENPLLICIDQEGGKVARLKEEKGFNKSYSAKTISTFNEYEAKESYDSLANELHNLGINLNFAPLVDLGINKESKIIYGLDRTYGEDNQTVIKYAEIFMDALANHKIISVLKHFPGHGSSKDDSHEGFVDITNSWNEIELVPYKQLLHKTKMIMSAHVFNGKLDDKLPATLSYSINSELLRKKLGYDEVLLTDDLQMAAIKAHFPKEKTIELAINSGADMLMYCNQLGNDDTKETVDIMEKLVLDKKISYDRIIEANNRINRLMKGICS